MSDVSLESLPDQVSIAPDQARPPIQSEGREPAGVDETVRLGVETLTRIALTADDPVTALDEGADALADALARRDLSLHAQALEVREQEIDMDRAYRHARQHRVSELMGQGYGFDHALAITDNNEAEIRHRAAVAGSNPMDAIYNYAVHNGYRSPAKVPDRPSPEPSAIEKLAALDDQAFAKATDGDAWRRLMGGS